MKTSPPDTQRESFAAECAALSTRIASITVVALWLRRQRCRLRRRNGPGANRDPEDGVEQCAEESGRLRSLA